MENRKPLILIIDDNPENIQVLGGLLSDEGFNPAGVSNGEKALELLKKRKPDLILLDILMPDIDGYQLCSAIKKDETNKDIPVVFLTAKTEEKDILKGFECGGVDYITKPFNTSELLARVKTHIELKHVREKLYELSITDDLTGLYNRRHFKEEMKREINRAIRHKTPLSLAIMDIDHFKNINDTYGHEIGDRVLNGLAALFQRAFRKCDVIGRLGGEEFAVILPETDLNDARFVTERFRKIVEDESGELTRDKMPITISIGVTERRGRTQEIDDLLREADEALYKAKNDGRNRVILYQHKN